MFMDTSPQMNNYIKVLCAVLDVYKNVKRMGKNEKTF